MSRPGSLPIKRARQSDCGRSMYSMWMSTSHLINPYGSISYDCGGWTNQGFLAPEIHCQKSCQKSQAPGESTSLEPPILYPSASEMKLVERGGCVWRLPFVLAMKSCARRWVKDCYDLMWGPGTVSWHIQDIQCCSFFLGGGVGQKPGLHRTNQIEDMFFVSKGLPRGNFEALFGILLMCQGW